MLSRSGETAITAHAIKAAAAATAPDAAAASLLRITQYPGQQTGGLYCGRSFVWIWISVASLVRTERPGWPGSADAEEPFTVLFLVCDKKKKRGHDEMPSCTRSTCPPVWARLPRYAGAGPARLPQAGPNLERD